MIRRFTFLAVVLGLALAASAQTHPADQPIPGGGGYGGAYGGMMGGMGGYGRPDNPIPPQFPEDQAYRELSLRWFADGPVPDLNSLSDRLRKQIPIDAAKELKLGDKIIEQLGRDNTFYALIKPGESSWELQISLTFPKAEKVPVDRLMNAIIARLRTETVESAQRQAEDRRMRLEIRHKELEKDTAEMADRVTAITAKLRDLTGRLSVSPDVLRSAMARLDDERQTLEIDKEDQAARSIALRESIAAQADKLKDQIRSDAVSAELEKAAQAREEAVKRIEASYKAGMTQSSEVQSAISALAELRARLAERRESLATTGQGQLLMAWNKELLNLSIDMRQKAARLSAIEASLKKLQAAAPLLDELQRTQEKRDDLKKRLDDLASQIQSVEKENRRLPVLITTQQ